MDKLRMETPDLTQKNIEKLATLFPACVTEARGEDGKLKKAVNFELLRQMLSDVVLEGDEAYEFTWVGKKAAIVEANKPIRKTLRPCPAESVNWDTTENLYIEGDNLEVLKLLQESYLGKVKMIYIDPPYNTGHDFVYPDSFIMDSEEYDAGSGYFDEDGNINYSRTNENSRPRFHSDWCSMTYSRLMLARNLLTDDGVIFISVDDSEIGNLRKICDEVFGVVNFLATFVWQKKYGPANDAKGVSATHEYILLYGKKANNWIPGLLERNEEQLKAYKNPDNDPRGIWRASDLSARTYSASCDYVITGPTGLKFSPPPSRSWIVSKENYQRLLADNRITFGSDGTGRPMQKKFITEVKAGITPETWLPRDKGGDNKVARYELKDIFPENVFDTPKPSQLLMYLSKIAGLSSNAIILDFFSGSATTAHAVMQLNAEDGGHRKFIMVQLPEPCDEKSEAYKAGYKNICEIGKERIRRAGKKILQSVTSGTGNSKGEGFGCGMPTTAEERAQITKEVIDVGFRVFKLDDANMTDVYYSAGEYDQTMLDQLVSNIKPDRTDLDLLFGCLLEWGLPLSMPYTSEKIEGCTIHTYNDGDLIACFDEDIPDTVIKEIAKRQPLRAVFRDSSFADSPAKINVGEIFKMLAPDTRVKVL